MRVMSTKGKQPNEDDGGFSFRFKVLKRLLKMFVSLGRIVASMNKGY